MNLTTNGRPEVVVITGASAGIGRATARAFARRGAHIGLLARGRDGLDAARREVEGLGGRALVCVADVADENAVEAAAAAVEQEFGPLDIWVNNAMVSVFSPVVETTPDEYRRVTEVTYLGYVWGTQAALRRMRPRNRGVIVLVGSALAYRGIPLQSAYCAAKHAIQGFCDAVRCELINERSQVQVCMVEMPAVNTPQFRWVKSRLPHKASPVPPIYQPEVAAQAIVHAATGKRREIYVGFSTVEAVVVNKWMAGVLDYYLGRTGVKSQQTNELEDPDRPNNLFHPLPGDHGAEGAFSNRARHSSFQLWLTMHRGILLLALVGIVVIVLLAMPQIRRSL